MFFKKCHFVTQSLKDLLSEKRKIEQYYVCQKNVTGEKNYRF